TKVTPIERWLGHKPASNFIDHLRTFGCRCFVYNYRRNSKMGDRAVEAIFLGYELTSKNYRVLLSQGKRVTKIDAINVKFFENEFPAKEMLKEPVKFKPTIRKVKVQPKNAPML